MGSRMHAMMTIVIASMHNSVIKAIRLQFCTGVARGFSSIRFAELLSQVSEALALTYPLFVVIQDSLT
jgi:hypothetical protein